jgi:predicted RNase H-like HicB family nuclease
MSQVVCEVSAGLRDSERTAAVRDVFGRRQFLRVEHTFLTFEDNRWYLPVGIVGIDPFKQLALIELPHEADSGKHRLWVRMGDFRESTIPKWYLESEKDRLAAARRDAMPLMIEVEREDDGRWIAEVPELPGVMAYGQTREEAIDRAQSLSLRVLADRLDHGEPVTQMRSIFTIKY